MVELEYVWVERITSKMLSSRIGSKCIGYIEALQRGEHWNNELVCKLQSAPILTYIEVLKEGIVNVGSTEVQS